MILNKEEIEESKDIHITFGNLSQEKKDAAWTRMQEMSNAMIRLFGANILQHDLENLLNNSLGFQAEGINTDKSIPKVRAILTDLTYNDPITLGLFISLIFAGYALAMELESLKIEQLVEGTK